MKKDIGLLKISQVSDRELELAVLERIMPTENAIHDRCAFCLDKINEWGDWCGTNGDLCRTCALRATIGRIPIPRKRDLLEAEEIYKRTMK